MKKFSIFVLLIAAVFVFFPQPAEAADLIKGIYVSGGSSYGDSRTLILTLDKDTDDCTVTQTYKYVSGSTSNPNWDISLSQSGQNKRGERNLGGLYETTSYTVDCVNRKKVWWDQHDGATVVAKVNPTVIVLANGQSSSLQMQGTESLNIGWSGSTNARSCKLTSPYTANNLPRFGQLPTINPGDSAYPTQGVDGSRIFLFECTESPGGEAQPPGGWGTGSNGVYVFLGAQKPSISMYVNGVDGDTSIAPNDNLTVSWDINGNGWGIYGYDYPDAIDPPKQVLSGLYKSFPYPWPLTDSDSVTYTPGDSLHPTPDGRSYVLTGYTAAGTTVVNHNVYVVPLQQPPTVSLEVKKSGAPDATYSGGPININSGEQVTLKWAVTGDQVASCNWTSGLTGSASVSGGTTNASPNSDTDYSLRCSNFKGTGDSNVVSVDVIAKQCNDGIDNDSDGFVDYPDDPGCTGPSDDDEYNAPPSDAVLRVQSSGATGVLISRVSGTAGIGGTTNPDFYIRTSGSDISGVIEAPASWGGGNFQNWSNCTPVNGRQCSVSVSPGAAQTVTATYQTPSYAVLNVESTGITGVGITSGDSSLAGPTNYASTSESIISGTLTAPSSYGNWNFANWSGCSPGSGGRDCVVRVNPGEQQTVAAHYSAPPSLKQCNDGVDNDGDSLIDYPADPGCSSSDDNDESNGPPPPPPPPSAACSDGIDNDDDGLIDWPADIGCSSPDDDDETFRFLRRIFREL